RRGHGPDPHRRGVLHGEADGAAPGGARPRRPEPHHPGRGTTMSIRVLVCDDDPIVRDALSGYLRTAEEIEVTATAGTAEEALAFLTDAEAAAPPSLEDPAAAPRADVVLMDLAMPGMGG